MSGGAPSGPSSGATAFPRSRTAFSALSSFPETVIETK